MFDRPMASLAMEWRVVDSRKKQAAAVKPRLARFSSIQHQSFSNLMEGMWTESTTL